MHSNLALVTGTLAFAGVTGVVAHNLNTRLNVRTADGASVPLVPPAGSDEAPLCRATQSWSFIKNHLLWRANNAGTLGLAVGFETTGDNRTRLSRHYWSARSTSPPVAARGKAREVKLFLPRDTWDAPAAAAQSLVSLAEQTGAQLDSTERHNLKRFTSQLGNVLPSQDEGRDYSVKLFLGWGEGDSSRPTYVRVQIGRAVSADAPTQKITAIVRSWQVQLRQLAHFLPAEACQGTTALAPEAT